MALKAGTVFAGREIVQSLGTGGMGQVYLTRNARLGRLEAIKVTPIAGTGTLPQRFVSEATTLASLDHPNIATIYQFGVDDDFFWYAMKYLPGDDLSHQVPLARLDAATVATQVGHALDYAHSTGVIHRDIKPSNIHIQRSTANRITTATILDFGVAKSVGATALTEINTFVGTLSYSAPEMITGGPCTPAADQYSFACTAFEMLTGRPPYPEATLTALIAAHSSAPVPMVSVAAPNLAACDPVFARALAKDPRDRYPSCGAFADALVAALDARRHIGRTTVDRYPHHPIPEHRSDDEPSLSEPCPEIPSPPVHERRIARRQAAVSPISAEVFVRRRRIAAGIAFVAVLAAIALILRPFDSTTTAPQTTAVSSSTSAHGPADGPLGPPATGVDTHTPSSSPTGRTWALAIAPSGQTFAFRNYPDPESLMSAAMQKWNFNPQTWSLAYFDSGCASFARPIEAAAGRFAYQSGLGPDRRVAEATAVAKSEQLAHSPSRVVDTLCVGDEER